MKYTYITIAVFSTILIFFLSILTMTGVAFASTIESAYEPSGNDNDYFGLYNGYNGGQIFNSGDGYTIESVSIFAHRLNSLTTVKACIWSVSGNLPDEELQCSDEIDMSSFTTDTGGEWANFPLVYALSPSTDYYIVITVGSYTPNQLRWHANYEASSGFRGMMVNNSTLNDEKFFYRVYSGSAEPTPTPTPTITVPPLAFAGLAGIISSSTCEQMSTTTWKCNATSTNPFPYGDWIFVNAFLIFLLAFIPINTIVNLVRIK